tara:strand:- start:332 stop:463 length:132 start_codon:yes stop_codon:yes gene_type:complete
MNGDAYFGEVYFHAYPKIMRKTGDGDVVIPGRYINRHEKRGDV